MFNIKLQPRAYRVREVIVTSVGFPEPRWQLQCQTSLGWNTIYLFSRESKAREALIKWKETLA